MRGNPDSFKVDATIVPTREYTTVIYNCNIPKVLVDNDESRRDALKIVRQLIITDFPNSEVQVQLTASYILVDDNTGEEYTWIGSFWSDLNEGPAALTPFFLFNANTFAATTFRDSSNIEEVLRLGGLNSKWKFNRLLSLIVNINTRVQNDDAILRTRHFISPTGKRPH